jgi:hypothetical protein
MLTRIGLLIGALGLAIGVTGPKLYKMTQIKGWLPGASVQQRPVTEKWHQTPDDHPNAQDTYWVAFTEDDIRKVGHHRLNVEPEKWESLSEGDSVDVVYVSGSPEPYLRDGIFVSWGNFVFDLVLLGLEVGVVGVMAVQLRRLYTRDDSGMGTAA